MSFITSITKPYANVGIVYTMPGIGKTTFKRSLEKILPTCAQGVIACYDTDDFPLDSDKELANVVGSIAKGHSASIYILFTNRYRIVSDLVLNGASLLGCAKWDANPDAIAYARSLVQRRGSRVELYKFEEWLQRQPLARFCARFASVLSVVHDHDTQAVFWDNMTKQLIMWLFTNLRQKAPYLEVTLDAILTKFVERGYVTVVNDASRNGYYAIPSQTLLAALRGGVK